MPSRTKAHSSQLNPDGTLRLDLGLSPQELMLPAWQMQYGLTAPEPLPFDFESCAKRLQKCCYSNTYIHSPEKAGIPVWMSPEEAWFWLRAMSTGFFKRSRFENTDSLKAPSLKQVRSFLQDFHFQKAHSEAWHPELASVLRTLLKPAEIMDFILQKMVEFKMRGLCTYENEFGNFAVGCCIYLTPYLTKTEREHHVSSHRSILLNDTDLTKSESIAALAILGILGETEIVTKVLQLTKAKLDTYCPWLLARTKTMEDYKMLCSQHEQKFSGVNGVKIALATTKLSCLPNISQCLSGLKPHQTRVMQVLRRVHHPEIASFMIQQRAAHKDAAGWIRDNPLLAAIGLAPHAAASGEHSIAAREFWHDLWRNDAHNAELALSHLPKSTAEFVQALGQASKTSLSRSDELPQQLLLALKKAPARKLPAWLKARSLPKPEVEKQPLDSAHITTLIGVLKIKPGAPKPQLVTLAKEHCSADTLSDFADAIFKQWKQEGCPPSDIWVLDAVGWLGSDDVHLRLARYLPYVPMKSQWPHQRACAGVRALAASGTPVAFNQIYRLANSTYDSMQRTEALQSLARLASEQNLSMENLADRCVPDVGFDLAGRQFFKAGESTIEARLDEHLTLGFIWADGKSRRRLPPMLKALTKPDFQMLCSEARRARRLLRDTVELQITRLRQSISLDYARPVQAFRSQVLGHPILVRIARQMVWSCNPLGSESFAFRPAEDGTIVDAHGETIPLPEDGSVRLASEAVLSAAEIAAWLEHLVDHEIIQPIKQFSGHACLPLSIELDAVRVNRFSQCPTTIGNLKRTFASENWSHDKPQEDGGYTRHFRAYPAAEMFACVKHSRVWIQERGWKNEIVNEQPAEIEDIWFIPANIAKKEWRNSKHYIPMKQVPAAVFSEVFTLLHRMTGLPTPQP
jgi:hypothetical protein